MRPIRFSFATLISLTLAACGSFKPTSYLVNRESAATQATTPLVSPTPFLANNAGELEGGDFRLPVVTNDHQGLTYHDGQMVVIYANGLPPDTEVAVTLIHETQGEYEAYFGRSDASGALLVLYVVEPEEIPNGRVTFVVTGKGTIRQYELLLDHDQPAQIAQTGCGVYPSILRAGMQFIAWCGGFPPSGVGMAPLIGCLSTVYLSTPPPIPSSPLCSSVSMKFVLE